MHNFIHSHLKRTKSAKMIVDKSMNESVSFIHMVIHRLMTMI